MSCFVPRSCNCVLKIFRGIMRIIVFRFVGNCTLRCAVAMVRLISHLLVNVAVGGLTDWGLIQRYSVTLLMNIQEIGAESWYLIAFTVHLHQTFPPRGCRLSTCSHRLVRSVQWSWLEGECIWSSFYFWIHLSWQQVSFVFELFLENIGCSVLSIM